MLTPITAGSGHNLTKFYHGMWLIAGVITWTLILQGVLPRKIGEGKNVQNSARFLTTFDFDRKCLRIGSTFRKSEKYLINYISSLLGEKIGKLWSTHQTVIGALVDAPNWTFSEYYIWALGGAGGWPLKFLHTLDTGQGLLAHVTNRVGVPQNFKGEHLKLGLKFYI